MGQKDEYRQGGKQILHSNEAVDIILDKNRHHRVPFYGLSLLNQIKRHESVNAGHAYHRQSQKKQVRLVKVYIAVDLVLSSASTLSASTNTQVPQGKTPAGTPAVRLFPSAITAGLLANRVLLIHFHPFCSSKTLRNNIFF